MNAARRDDDDASDAGAAVDPDLEAEGDVLAPRDLVAVDDPDSSEPPPALPAAAIARARGYAAASRAASTRAKYETAWDSFSQWCSTQDHECLPAHPGTVAVFLTEEAARSRGARIGLSIFNGLRRIKSAFGVQISADRIATSAVYPPVASSYHLHLAQVEAKHLKSLQCFSDLSCRSVHHGYAGRYQSGRHDQMQEGGPFW